MTCRANMHAPACMLETHSLRKDKARLTSIRVDARKVQVNAQGFKFLCSVGRTQTHFAAVIIVSVSALLNRPDSRAQTPNSAFRPRAVPQ